MDINRGVQSEHLTLHKSTFLGGGLGSLQRLLNFHCNPKRAICCIFCCFLFLLLPNITLLVSSLRCSCVLVLNN